MSWMARRRLLTESLKELLEELWGRVNPFGNWLRLVGLKLE